MTAIHATHLSLQSVLGILILEVKCCSVKLSHLTFQNTVLSPCCLVAWSFFTPSRPVYRRNSRLTLSRYLVLVSAETPAILTDEL
jgi:hypothetical protein